MMKRIFVLAFLFHIIHVFLCIPPAFGHPVWGEKIVFTQPNGIEIIGYIYGDEFHRRIETEEGYTIILNEQTGFIEYAMLEDNKLVPSGMIVGIVSSHSLQSMAFPKHLTDRKFKIAEIRRTSQERLHDLISLPHRVEGKALSGTKKVFLVCVEFQPEDAPPTSWYSGTYSPTGFDERLFSTDPSDISMTNFYKSNSYNQFWPEGYSYSSWITLPHTASYYKSLNSWRQIIRDAMDEIRNINPTFDFTQYADDGDMDMILVWAGRTEGWGDFYWPHKSSAYINRYGIRVKFYNAVNERFGDGSENTGIGVFCHEYGHMTGSPDLYDYDSFQLRTVGYYGIMANSVHRTHFCGFLKWRVYGWVTPEDIFSSGTYSTDALGLPSASNPRLYRINIESPEEYLLIENRYNGADPDYENYTARESGLFITHIDENYPPADGLPTYTFYGVEAIVPGLDTSITTLDQYSGYYGEMVFSSDEGYTRLEPSYPDDQLPGSYITLTTGDDTENVIYRNTQGHSLSTDIYITDISSSQQTMSFSVTVSAASPSVSGSVKTPGGDGIDGVTLNFSDGGGTTNTDSSGKYDLDVPSGWSGTVSLSKTGYVFDPPSRSYSNVLNSQIDQNYVSSTSLLKGRITNSMSEGIEYVWIIVYSSSGSFAGYGFTGSNGDYAIGDLSTGSYKLLFDTSNASGMYGLEWYDDQDSWESSDSVSVTEGSITSGIDAVLTEGGGISGRVTNVIDAGIENVIVDVYTTSGEYVTYTVTDIEGDYEFETLKAGSYKLEFDTTYTIDAFLSEWYNDKDSVNTADPVSVTGWNITSGIDAVLSYPTPVISGNVSTTGTSQNMKSQARVDGVVMNGLPGNPSTNASGNYSAIVDFGWSGTVTPTKVGYTFSPPSRTYADVNSDQLNQNYTATAITFIISGSVKNSGDEGIEGVAITFSNNGGTAFTDSSGSYSHLINYGWSGTATPSKDGYTFSPSNRNYTDVTSDYANQDYTGSIIQCTLTLIAEAGGTTQPSPGSYAYDYGTQVTITALPNSGYQFSFWSGDESGFTNPITVTMDRDKSITAIFSSTDSGSGTSSGDSGPEGGGGCFIATAAYGSPVHPHLDMLRDFRDRYLLTNRWGRAFVDLYYKYSPSIARIIAENRALKIAVQINLMPLVILSYSMVHFGPVWTAMMFVLIFSFSVFLVRKGVVRKGVAS